MGKKSRKKRDKMKGPNADNPKRSVLADHAKQGRRLVPPLAQLPLSHVSWNREMLPDTLWIALLIDKYGPKRGVELTLAVVEAAEKLRPANEQPQSDDFVDWTPMLIDCYASLSRDDQDRILEAIDQETRDAIQVALLPLIGMYAECPLGFLIDEKWRDTQRVEPVEAMATLSRVMSEALDRRTKFATWVQATCVYCSGVTGRLFFHEGSSLANLGEIEQYPNTDESQKVAAFVRASVNSILGRSTRSAWPEYFWNHGYDISPCTYAERDMDADASVEVRFRSAADAAAKYAQGLLAELKERWAAVRPNIAAPTRDEVLGALLARQARLSSAIARDPRLWSVDLGQMMLRAMVETYLTLRWLGEKGELADFKNFVEYGLGQEKLLLEHMKAQLPDEVDGRFPDELEPMQRWIDSQLYTFLLPVQLTSWKSVRSMAEELEELDVYDLNFARYSSELHGSWNSLAKVNLKACVNPLHALHRTPTFEAPALFLGILSSAVGLMHDTYLTWADAMNVSKDELSSVSEFYKEMDDAGGEDATPPDDRQGPETHLE